MRAPFLLSFALTAGALSAQDNVCTITPAGSNCGPLLAISFEPIGHGSRQLVLHASGLHRRAVGAMVWGFNALDLPVLPGSSCLLLTDYVWGHTFITDSNGEYEFQRAWPVSFVIGFRMQMGSLVERHAITDVLMTDCKLVECHL